MKRRKSKKWYQFSSLLLAMVLLFTSVDLQVFASEVSGGDAGTEATGTYTLVYDATYLKTPIATRENVPFDEEIVLPTVEDYVVREGYYIDWIWMWVGYSGSGRWPGSTIKGNDFSNLTDGGTVRIVPGYVPVQYTISYVLEPLDVNGTPITDADNPAINASENAKTYTIESSLTLEPATKTGYTFEGWYLDADYAQKIEKIEPGRTGDITLYAKWGENTYTVYFDGNQGTPQIESKVVKYTESFSMPTATSDEPGYRLRSWQLKDSERYFAIGETASRLCSTHNGSVTLVANYSNAFGTITYVTEPLDESGNPINDVVNPAKNNPDNIFHYTYGDCFAFLPPVKTGYTFEGWYLDKEYSEEITEIKATDSNDFVLYAKWKEHSYTLNIYANDGTNKVQEVPLKYTDEYTLPSGNLFSRNGYQFVCWNTKQSAESGTQYEPLSKVSRMTDEDGSIINLYAIWNPLLSAAMTSSRYRTASGYARWAENIHSYLLANADGTLSRVEHNGNDIYVENYTAQGKFTGGLKLPMELSLWGGFYAGSQYNYFVFGQKNPEEDTSLEVIRVVRYTKEWRRVDSLAINDIGVYVPFEAGTLNMTEMKGRLIIHTCRTMYASDDGLHHQANLTLFVDALGSTMRFLNPLYGAGGNSHLTVNSCAPGYCSHSFSQKIANDGQVVITADHGDAYPRNIRLRKYPDAELKGSSYVDIYPIPGNIGDNYTGVTLGGVEISSSGYLVTANSVDFNVCATTPFSGQRNIFVAYVPADSFKAANVEIKWITDYTSGTYVTAPSLMKLSEDKFMLLWGESGNKVKYVYLDDKGEMTGSVATLENTWLSEGEPIVVNKKVVWYYTKNSAPIFVSIGKFMVNFDSMGGTQVSDKFYLTTGQKYRDGLKEIYGDNAAFPVPEKTGYQFAGWYTAKEGGTKINEDSNFAGIADTTLYAHWEKKSYTVAFDTGCDITVEPITVYYDSAYGKLPTVDRYGYELTGWYTEKEGGEKVTEDTIYKEDGNTTLYARYKEVYYLTFDANGGQFVDENKVSLGTTYLQTLDKTEIPAAVTNVSKKGYAFTGWYTEKTGGESFDFSKCLTGHTTVYAHYEPLYKAADVVANPDDGTELNPGTYISLSCATPGAAIYYYADATMAAESGFTAKWLLANGILYENPIRIVESVNLYAIAIAEDYNDGNVGVFHYLVKPAEENWGDVQPQDRSLFGNATEVPEKLWIAGIEDKVYNSTARTQSFRVYYGRKLLSENSDYTVKYKNNTKAGTATLAITGKGCYTGSMERQFTILPMDISKADVPDIQLLENGKVQKGTTTVTLVLNGKTVKLKKGVDFDFIYEDGAYTIPGEYSVIVRGKGNFAGSETRFTETILSKEHILMSKVNVAKIKDHLYNGSEIRLTEEELIVKYGRDTLLLGTDYVVDHYDCNTEIGTASLTIKGTGTKYVGNRTVTFKITGIPMNKVAVNNLEKSFIYNGKEQIQEALRLTYSYKDAANETITDTLEPGKDYDVAYGKNVDAGTATLVITGKGKYTGTIKKTFRITPYDLKGDEAGEKRITVIFEENYHYVKGGVMVKPVVIYYYGDYIKTLEEGKDYTLSYKNQTTVTVGNTIAESKKPVVMIRGKGNFTGTYTTERPLTYEIKKTDISGLTMKTQDVVYRDKAGICKPVIALYDINGKKLAAGTDYDKTIVYTYKNDVAITKIVNKQRITVFKDAKALVEKEDIIPAGTEIVATVYALNTEKCGYAGTIAQTFRIVEADIGKCKVTYSPAVYDPAGMCFVKSDFKVTFGKQDLESNDYQIESVVISEKDKKATVILAGTGKFGGKKTVTVKINPLSIKEP